MPSHFKKSESPGRALRRVHREELAAALARLRKSRRPSAIHHVRKQIKKLRAIWGLVRAAVGETNYRKGSKPLRQAAERLANPRDARVMLRAFQKLTENCAGRFPRTREILQQHCRREIRQFRKAESAAAAEQFLRKANRRANRLQIKATGWPAIAPGLQQTYAGGREKFHLLCREPSSEHFHQLRKQVKNLAFYLPLICPHWPPAIRALVDELELLGEQLGEEHDLFLLQQFVAKQGCVAETRVLNRLLAPRQRALRAQALKLSAPIFVEPPEAVCRQLEADWNRWRET